MTDLFILRLPVLNLAEQTNILEDCAVLARAQVFVGNDSGLGHMASAVAIPTLTVFGREQEVHRVGHQGIGMQGAPFFLHGLARPVQVSMVVLFGKETRLAVMAALHNVKRHTVKRDARAAGHANTLHPPENYIEPGTLWPSGRAR